ncbi:MAG: hypothetical protein K0Q66_2038 [Chitinophagaceae bacterium]|jgi:hypothetical protein|nr:hypothetical protein [Chitinophagaceae bacterium]
MKQMLAITALALLFACNDTKRDGAENGAAADGEKTSSKSSGDLYLRTYMWTGMYGSSLDISWILMDDEGNIVKNPKHGVNPVDWAKEKAENAKQTGTYKIDGKKLNITWVDGKTASWSLEEKDGEYSIIDGGITTKQEGMPTNYRIEGKYAASAVMPNVSASHTLVFQKDGTFTSSNYGTVTTTDVTSESQKSNAGTYDISGNTLTMKFPDGKVEKSVITIWDMDGKKYLIIDNSSYPQEK